MPWLLNLIYLLILPAITPVLLWQRVVNGKRREGIWCKLTGRLVRRTGDRRLVWFHAVSVGEVLQLEPMIAECQSRWPSLEILVTTTTARTIAPRVHFQYAICPVVEEKRNQW